MTESGTAFAVVTTMLARGAQTHRAVMVGHLTPYDPAFQQRVGELAVRGTPGIAVQQAYGGIYATLVRQATLLSYIDIFRVLAFLCLLCVPATLLFERVKKKAGPVAMH